ncbi:MAG: hypothetical protein UT61_C0051G0007 [Candidatus Woesebacteria bacterium GW2011_GWA1_39_8]|uniref:Transposase IS200-like domain-containing protein n=1 Tax=Candidatus Woesebacteria bacterium GW2011_GWA1_39_8 TaxID=1618552 RepID=A0A0G0S142_9BACT|nr:MAG: hypothetical protein UT61_C0051G0007 [Candidatus Woesebacteria bacterium GW2011_GWA1_39_8]
MRKDLLVNGEIYHVFVRSIADFIIFNNNDEFNRITQLIKYYQSDNPLRLSDFLDLKIVQKEGFNNSLSFITKDKDKLVQIIAFCFMPTHIHLLLKQLTKNGISDYMRKILDGYTRYFNTIHKRKGPLWEGKFRNVLVKTDEQLIHLTRYIHLNPVSAALANKPEDWEYSSYAEYLSEDQCNSMCLFSNIIDIQPSSYRKFVNDQISYQRDLAIIKHQTIDS